MTGTPLCLTLIRFFSCHINSCSCSTSYWFYSSNSQRCCVLTSSTGLETFNQYVPSSSLKSLKCVYHCDWNAVGNNSFASCFLSFFFATIGVKTQNCRQRCVFPPFCTSFAITRSDDDAAVPGYTFSLWQLHRFNNDDAIGFIWWDEAMVMAELKWLLLLPYINCSIISHHKLKYEISFTLCVYYYYYFF